MYWISHFESSPKSLNCPKHNSFGPIQGQGKDLKVRKLDKGQFFSQKK